MNNKDIREWYSNTLFE